MCCSRPATRPSCTATAEPISETHVHVRLGSGQGTEATVVVNDMPPHELELVEHRPCQGDAVLCLDRVDLASHLDEALVQQPPVHGQLALCLLDVAT